VHPSDVEAPAESGQEPALAEDSTCACRFACLLLALLSLRDPCVQWLAQIKEPNWDKYVQLSDESGFEIYQTKTLVEVEEEPWNLARDIKAKLNTGKALDANSLFRVKRAGQPKFSRLNPQNLT
jgi:hypothetical protein